MLNKIFLDESSEGFFKIHEEWKNQAKTIKNLEEFNIFFNHLINDYHHDYGTMCRAIGQLAVAAASLGANIEGITGFQASFVMWEFIKNWTFNTNKTGLKILDYDDMLYPQYQYKFEKTISKDTWKFLQEEAKQKLHENLKYAHPDVIKHWQNIANGKVPFGYSIKEK